MPLVLNEEQRLLKDTAKEFLGSSAPVEALRKLRDEKNEIGYDKALWQQMAELGWAGIVLPEDYDGLDFGFMGLGAIIEESGRTLTASPLFSTVVLGASAILLGGSDEQKQSLLPSVASGEKTLTLAVDEYAHHNPAAIALSAKAQGENFVLTGKKVCVVDGHTADHIVVAARTSGTTGSTDGISLFIVDGDAEGLTRTRRWMADSRAVAELNFDKVSGQLLGELDKGWDILDPVLDRGRICLAAEMLGGTQEIFKRTVDYLKEREQFGVKIGSFQALKHRAAHMFTEIELAKSVVLDAFTAIDEGRADLGQMASFAKATVNDLYYLVSNEAVQMHGGIGVTDELEIGFFLKRSRMAIQLLGDSGFHRDRYASLSGY
ncbi:alkylation response protein AidB-like acyl-CoA dehydrogenase [Litorivivens lipolytica]|uniref:Alkylation response protein AidB-like acyl-CoA dehydrogenase n=1 Tax=Litorivivens lipolytica TaxID=1524264 RepID=A0A7W4W307_9GAMM|nr:acyl-CoA dehydrogenase family protein [Litorivivens lipolytica]MBB3045972.1 alkylation response protein AidB-like acyl-CoA dehydrogenase [Litorivivens lipolytica]